MRLENGSQIIVNNISTPASGSIHTLATTSASPTGLINSNMSTPSSQQNSDIQNSTLSYASTIMKTLKKSVNIFNIKQHYTIASIKKTQILDIPVFYSGSDSSTSLFKISTNKYEDLLKSSYRLRSYMEFCKPYFANQNLFNYLNNIISDLEIFLNLQLRLEQLKIIADLPIDALNNSKTSLLLKNHMALNKLFSLPPLPTLSSNTDKLVMISAPGSASHTSNTNIHKYNNLFNKELFYFLINTSQSTSFVDTNLTMNKLKEFYIINDLDYLNSKTKKIIHINFYHNYILFKTNFIKDIQSLIETSLHIPDGRVEKLSALYFNLNGKFNTLMSSFDQSTLDNIKLKYNVHVKFKDVDQLKFKNIDKVSFANKLRLTQFYRNL